MSRNTLLRHYCFDINYGKMKGRMVFDIIDRSIGIKEKRLLNVYRKIFGTRSYGEDVI